MGVSIGIVTVAVATSIAGVVVVALGGSCGGNSGCSRHRVGLDSGLIPILTPTVIRSLAHLSMQVRRWGIDEAIR